MAPPPPVSDPTPWGRELSVPGTHGTHHLAEAQRSARDSHPRAPQAIFFAADNSFEQFSLTFKRSLVHLSSHSALHLRTSQTMPYIVLILRGETNLQYIFQYLESAEFGGGGP